MTVQWIQVYKVFHLSIFKEDHDDVYGVVVHGVVIITLTAIVCIMNGVSQMHFKQPISLSVQV